MTAIALSLEFMSISTTSNRNGLLVNATFPHAPSNYNAAIPLSATGENRRAPKTPRRDGEMELRCDLIADHFVLAA